MKRRIFLDMLLLTAITLALVTAALCLVFYRQYSETVAESLQNRAETFVDNSSKTAIEALAITKSSDMRVTVIKPDGTVVFDTMAREEQMQNHLDREEISDALERGYGQSLRFSDTLQKETVYYAVKLTDGYVLRVAKTSSSIWGVFIGILPVVAVVVLIAVGVGYLLARSLTRRIIAPLGSVSPEEDIRAPYDELAPFIRTIAEQRAHMARQLSELQNRADTIGAIMDNMKEGIILTNQQGLILAANRSVLRILEEDSSVDGRNLLEFLRDPDFSAHVREALLGKHGEMLMELGGRTYRLYFNHAKGSGAIILFLDISERARAEKLRREFSANVSHELKTPLTSIYGSAEMLENGIVREEDRQRFYGKIKDEAGRLMALIEDILMLSKLDEGGGQAAFALLDLCDIAREAAEALWQKAAQGGVLVQVSGEAAELRGNRSLLYELFYNLIDNAIKYNRAGGSVVVETVREGEGLCVRVSDTGIGIPKEAHSRVFERFYRVDKSRSKKTGGTGLGLAIVKHIVRIHGGEIGLWSRLGEGTTVTVRFPSMP